LKLVYKAGKLARKREQETVTEPLVREAKRLIEQGRVKDELESLPVQSQLTLYTLLQLSAEGETPARRKKIYERYQVNADVVGADVVTDRTIHDRLSQLRLKGFVEDELRNEGRGGGKYYLYELGLQEDVVMDALSESSRVEDLFQEEDRRDASLEEF
jgi:cell division control protein 6